jgi:hypothetical protein
MPKANHDRRSIRARGANHAIDSQLIVATTSRRSPRGARQ